MADRVILAVDDEPYMLNYYREFLQLAGFAVRTAGTVDEALEVIAKVVPALVVLDLEMPGKNGEELLDYLATSYPEVPVLVVTAYASTSIWGKVERKLNSRVMRKPCSIQEICDVAQGMIV